MRPKVLTFANVKTKKTSVRRSPPRRAGVKFTARDKERARNLKAELVRQGMNEIQAELKAIRNIETLKIAGLLTPTPSPKRRTPPSPIKVVSGKHVRFYSPKTKKRTPPSPIKVVSGKHVRFYSPKTKKRTPPSPAKHVVFAGAGPSIPVPILSHTTTPRRRPRINTKLCTSYKKDELVRVLKRLGHRVNARMTVREMCSKVAHRGGPVTAVYTRPAGNSTVNVRKKTYEKHLKANLYRLAKNIGVSGVTTKSKKGEIVNKIRTKLNANVAKVLGTTNMSKVTARQIAEKLAKNHGWKNDRHVERVRLLKIYRNKV